MSILARKIQKIKPSPTLAVTSKARELKAKGIDIISLAAGEPDFDTPDNIKQAAIKGIQQGKTKYTPVAGTNELRQAVCDKFQRENNLNYDINEVIIGTGGKQIIYNLLMATINDGDEVIIPTPYWVSYPDMVLLSGGKPIFVDSTMDQDFKPKISDIEQSITNKTKWLILNSPSNPSGAIYTSNDLKEIAKLMEKYPDLHVMTDDIYEHIMFDDCAFHNLASVASEKLKDRIFIINGVSKAYSMTGWRIGYGAGHRDIIKAMSVIQSQSTSNPSSISQIAALEALTGTQDYITPNARNFQQKRDIVVKLLNGIDGIECREPKGAFYLFPKCSALFGKKDLNDNVINNSTDLATYFLEKANVAVVPGIAFGMDDHLRISYATSIELLKDACERLRQAIGQLK
ncbi:MAG: hypothetical protein DGJ47_000851 [Rickettsiaceae bacterium]